MPHEIVVSGQGQIRFIHSDKLAGLAKLGEATIARASHVEPYMDGSDIKWSADMSPVQGPLMRGFNNREEALDAEVNWLKEHGIPVAGVTERMGREPDQVHGGPAHDADEHQG